MSANDPSSETRTQRRELFVAYILGAVMLASLGYLYAQQRGWFRAAPVVERHATDLPRKPIELNSANWFELMQIQGIGEVRAKEIVRLRESKKRGFASFDELTAVRGITPEIVERMKEHVRLDTPGRKGRN